MPRLVEQDGRVSRLRPASCEEVFRKCKSTARLEDVIDQKYIAALNVGFNVPEDVDLARRLCRLRKRDGKNGYWHT